MGCGTFYCAWDWREADPATPFWENPGHDLNWDELLPLFEDEPVEPGRWFRHEGVPVLEVTMEGVFYKAVPIGIEEALDRALIICLHDGIVFQQVPIIDTDGDRSSEIPLEELDGPFPWEALMHQS